jgi:hypothetical protein
MTVSRFRTIIYVAAAIVSLAGLADATYLTVQALSSRQFVRQDSGDSGGLVWSACLFRCVHLRYVRGVRLYPRAHISYSNRRRDVSGYALAALRPGLPAARVLPLLPLLCGHDISACRAGDCSAARTRQICLISRPLSCLAHYLTLAHSFLSDVWSTSRTMSKNGLSGLCEFW